MESSLVYMMGSAMIIIGLGFLFLLFRGNEERRPRDVIEWTGVALSGLLIVSAAAMMVIASPGKEAATRIVATPETFEDMVMEAPAGDFAFNHVEGGSLDSLDAYRGKVVIVNFWGTWCAPCLEEIPALNRLQRELEDEGLVILSVSDESEEILQAFEQQLPLETISVRVSEGVSLPAPFSGAMVVRPTSFIIDRNGTARRYLLGNRSYTFFKNAVEPFL